MVSLGFDRLLAEALVLCLLVRVTAGCSTRTGFYAWMRSSSGLDGNLVQIPQFAGRVCSLICGCKIAARAGREGTLQVFAVSVKTSPAPFFCGVDLQDLYLPASSLVKIDCKMWRRVRGVGERRPASIYVFQYLFFFQSSH